MLMMISEGKCWLQPLTEQEQFQVEAFLVLVPEVTTFLINFVSQVDKDFVYRELLQKAEVHKHLLFIFEFTHNLKLYFVDARSKNEVDTSRASPNQWPISGSLGSLISESVLEGQLCDLLWVIENMFKAI